jgi:outer membrane lipoprotein
LRRLKMKKIILLAITLFFLSSCASVLRKDLMETGIRNFSFTEVVKNPEFYQGKLFILGGIVVNTKLTESGSLIEALYMPVDWQGSLQDTKEQTRRFLALYPKEQGILDPLLYDKNREITLAAILTGVEEGKVDEMGYTFPVFEAVQVYLWEKRPDLLYTPYPSVLYPYRGLRSRYWYPYR